ncbi:choice-of-anchor J domain-containing protein [Prevotella falsenii]|uniref:choice-of-anchor J domain-containing protein n=1 Tax=Prevotella falsenii TaxID=515414 RepID=UPI000B2531D5|nr:choice-of-anchor J domain-containing protein [Prevotella falsenii]
MKKATLTFDHAARYFGDFDKELKVQASTDGKTWKDLTIDKKPTGENWNFVTAKADLTAYCGKKIYISFFYNSTETTAATWEFKNLVVK